MKALLLVDIQNDFLPGGSLAVSEGDQILPLVNQLTQKPFDLVVATKDWHPEGHGSFAATHSKQIGERIQLNGIDQILWPTHCVQNSKGSQFPEELNIHSLDGIIYKGTDKDIDSYSGFFDNGQRKSTGLHDFLQENEIDTLYVAGLATDYCVKFTVLDALKLGYNVYLIQDACRAVNLQPEDEKNAIKEMQSAGAKIIDSSYFE